MSHLTIENLNKYYGSIQVLHDICLDLPSNSFVVFVGPSGCGKSTLLRCIAGLEDCEAEHIRLDDRDVSKEAPVDRNMAMVFQSYALYPQMSVAQNIAFPLKIARTPKEDMDAKVQDVAAFLQLDRLLDRKPKDLSGGQRQRVAIGRAVVRDPEVFLFDEPLSNLDAELRVEMRFQLAKLRRQLSATFIYVTHDQVEAMTLADQIVVLRDGYIEQVGAPLELYERPANQFVAGFIGSPKMNFFSLNPEGDDASLALPLGAAPDEINAYQNAQVVGIRPEHLFLDPDGPVQASAELIEDLGHTRYLHAFTEGGTRVILNLGAAQAPAIGETVHLQFDKTKMHLFDEAGTTLNL